MWTGKSVVVELRKNRSSTIMKNSSHCTFDANDFTNTVAKTHISGVRMGFTGVGDGGWDGRGRL
jgi:hypothetical protein